MAEKIEKEVEENLEVTPPAEDQEVDNSPTAEKDERDAKIDLLEKQVRKLIEVADKGRLAQWELENKEKGPQKVLLTTYRHKGKDKVITSWETTYNEIWKDAEGKWREKQEVEVTYEDGEIQKLPYVEFGSKTSKIVASVRSKKNVDGEITLKVEAENGKSYEINSLFVN